MRDIKRPLLGFMVLLLLSFDGYAATLSVRLPGHFSDYSITNNAPLLHSGLNGCGWFGGGSSCGVNRGSNGHLIADSGIHIGFILLVTEFAKKIQLLSADPSALEAVNTERLVLSKIRKLKPIRYNPTTCSSPQANARSVQSIFDAFASTPLVGPLLTSQYHKLARNAGVVGQSLILNESNS